MDEAARKDAIRALSQHGSVMREPVGGYGPVTAVDLGRGSDYVTDDVLVFLRQLPEVKHLYFDKTFVTDKIMEVLEFCPDLRTLNIKDTQVTDKGLEKLKYAHSLESFSIGYDYSPVPECQIPITDMGFQHVSLATNLTILDISQTWVTDKGLASIRNLVKLTYLFLCPEQVSEESIDVLKTLPDLKTIQLTNGYPREGPLKDIEPSVDALRKALPSIEVTY